MEVLMRTAIIIFILLLIALLIVIEVKKEEVKLVDTKAKVFEIQILSLTDRHSVELQQEAMIKKSVKTYISEFIKDGETYYRLRLIDKYKYHEAEVTGEKLKRDLEEITDYWIVNSD